MVKIVLIIFLFISIGYNSTYYIDYEKGDDTKSGKDTLNSWKNHPYMKNWKGSYNHNPGDSFIFKGGITWENEAFSLAILDGGDESNPDVYTSDSNWFSGKSWSRPVFDLQHKRLENPPYAVSINNIKNIRFENFEIKNQIIWGENAWSWGSIHINNSENIVINKCYVHSWDIEDFSKTPDQDFGGIFSASGKNIVIEYCTVKGNPVTGRDSLYSGVGIRNADTIRYCTVSDVPNGYLGSPKAMYGNEIYNIRTSYDSKGNVLTPPNGRHANGVYLFGGPIRFFNNKIHHILAPGAPHVFPAPGWNGKSAVIMLYNNIITENIHINGDGLAADNQAKCFIFNNIFFASNKCVVSSKKNNNRFSKISIKNNVFVTTGSYPAAINLAQPYDTLEIDYNLYINQNNKTNLCDGLPCVLQIEAARYNLNTTKLKGFNTKSIFLDGTVQSENELKCIQPTTNKGTNLSMHFNVDFFGSKIRPTDDGWDIGPFECSSVQNPKIGSVLPNFRVTRK